MSCTQYKQKKREVEKGQLKSQPGETVKYVETFTFVTVSSIMNQRGYVISRQLCVEYLKVNSDFEKK